MGAHVDKNARQDSHSSIERFKATSCKLCIGVNREEQRQAGVQKTTIKYSKVLLLQKVAFLYNGIYIYSVMMYTVIKTTCIYS